MLQTNIFENINNYLTFLKSRSCKGFEISQESLKIIESWTGRKRLKLQMDSGPKSPKIDIFKTDRSNESLEDIYNDIGDCKRCKLCTYRKKIVFGEGNPKAKLVFIGESPGPEENNQGRPFVGKRGDLLSRIIKAMYLERESVYICNIVMCHPPNRKPHADELKACFPFLERQIAAINPQCICTLGTISSQKLLNSNEPLSSLRGNFHTYKGIKVMPTFHPAYLLYNEDKKRLVWEDMKKIMVEMELL